MSVGIFFMAYERQRLLSVFVESIQVFLFFGDTGYGTWTVTFTAIFVKIHLFTCNIPNMELMHVRGSEYLDSWLAKGTLPSVLCAVK